LSRQKIKMNHFTVVPGGNGSGSSNSNNSGNSLSERTVDEEERDQRQAMSIRRSLNARLNTNTTWQIKTVSIDDASLPALVECFIAPVSANFLSNVKDELARDTLSTDTRALVKTVAEVLTDDRYLPYLNAHFKSVGIGSGHSGNLFLFVNPVGTSTCKRHLRITLCETERDDTPLLPSAESSPSASRRLARKNIFKRLLDRLRRRK
jgi:hypothetical protein